jgi:PAS domain S-box-containing protein
MATRHTSLGEWLTSILRRPAPTPSPDFASAIVEHLADGVVACDAGGRFVILNRRARAGTEELTPVTLPIDIPLDQWADHFQLYRPGGSELLATEDLPLVRALRGETVRDMELETRFSDNGGHAVLNVSGGPVLDPDGKIQGAVVVMQDITTRADSERETELGNAVAANIAVGVSMVRAADGEIVYANQQWERLFGYEPGELIGKHISVVNAPTSVTPEERAQEIFDALDRGDTWGGEFENIRKDGARLWTYGSISRFEHPEHGTVWITASADITDRKAGDRALHDAAERFRLVFEDAPIGIALVGMDLDVIDANRRLCEMVGWRSDELVGRPMSTIVHPDDHELDAELASQVLGGETPRYRVEKRYVTKGGDVWHAVLTATALRAPDGRPLYWIHTIEEPYITRRG